MKRTYIARIDTGRDFVYFVFYSEHRANSKANIEDAKKTYKRKHGHNPYKVTRTTLASDCDETEGTYL
jgi:hypothetical protein